MYPLADFYDEYMPERYKTPRRNRRKPVIGAVTSFWLMIFLTLYYTAKTGY
jgi:hypothetical protein